MSRGSTALPAALAALAVSAALAAAIADLTRMEVLVARHRRAATAALVATDACAARIVTAILPGWDFADVLAGPDTTPGTADDGLLAAPPGCVARASVAPGAALPPRVLVRLDAAAGGGRRVVDVLVGRDPAPAVPALLWLGGPPGPDAIGGRIALDGVDAADPAAAAWSGVAAPDDPAALDAWTAAQAGALAPTAGTAPPIAAPPPPFDALRDRLRAAGPGGAESLVPGGPPPPSLILIDGDLTVDTDLQGAGILFVTGRLDIESRLDFTGIVIARGGVRVPGGGTLAVRGALWTAADLAIDGTVDLRRSADAVTAADALTPLPRAAVLLGLRDVG